MATVRAPCTCPWEPDFASFFMGKKMEMVDSGTVIVQQMFEDLRFVDLVNLVLEPRMSASVL